mgnify:CR=1 FL=1
MAALSFSAASGAAEAQTREKSRATTTASASVRSGVEGAVGEAVATTGKPEWRVPGTMASAMLEGRGVEGWRGSVGWGGGGGGIVCGAS